MKKSQIDIIFESLKSWLIENYPGPHKIGELLIDIRYSRCLKAERDHYKDRRLYMHMGCKEDLVICISDSVDNLDVENIHGLFLHEIGHIIAIQLPEIYLNTLSEQEIDEINITDDDELVADMVIEKIFGVTIRYDHNKVQWVKI